MPPNPSQGRLALGFGEAESVRQPLWRAMPRPKGSYVFFVGWVHICPQARQLNHWIVPTASPPSRSLLPQLLQNWSGGGGHAGCGAEVFSESIRRSNYAGNCRLNDVLFWTVRLRCITSWLLDARNASRIDGNTDGPSSRSLHRH